MRQLTGLDASFLNLETGPVYGHVSSLCIYDPSTAAVPMTLERLRAHLASRMHEMPVFRRKLVEVPYHLDHPYWVDDAEFDIADHIYQTGLASPGTREQLYELVARIVARPLDRSRPLWEMAYITGLEDGKFALLTTMHHSVIDGASGADLLSTMLDSSVDAADVTPAPKPWKPEPAPQPVSLLASAVLANAWRPMKAARMQWDVVTQLVKPSVLRSLVPTAASAVTTGVGPRTPFNAKPTNRRVFVPFRVPLSEVKVIRKALDGTVNDVVMSICAGGLRRWLIDQNALPDKPLKAAVPVSIRSKEQKSSMGNQVSMIVADLPTDRTDPIERLGAVTEAMSVAKTQHGALPVATIIGFSDFATPAIASMAAREAQRVNLTSRFMPSNVAISNVPGPQHPMYLVGSELKEFYPVSMLADGQALNITLHSYNGRLDFGLIACPKAVPDLESLAEHILAEHRELLAAATSG